MSESKQNPRVGQLLSGNRLSWLALAVLGGVLLVYLAGDRIWTYLPFAIFLLCPLMHLFMHRGGHGGHGGHGGPAGGTHSAQSEQEAAREDERANG